MDRNNLRLRRRCRELGFHRLLVTPLFFLLAELFFRSSQRYCSRISPFAGSVAGYKMYVQIRIIHYNRKQGCILSTHCTRLSSSFVSSIIKPVIGLGPTCPIFAVSFSACCWFWVPYRALGAFSSMLIRRITKCGRNSIWITLQSLEFCNHLFFFAFCGSWVFSLISAYSQNENGPKSPNSRALSLSLLPFSFSASVDVYIRYMVYEQCYPLLQFRPMHSRK